MLHIYDIILSLQNGVFIGCCIKERVPYKNHYRTGIEGGYVQSDSKVCLIVQWPIGAPIPLVNNCDYLRPKYK